MPFFKDPGTESLAGEGSSHKLLPLCPAAHGRLHSLMAPPTGEISLGVSGIKPPSLWKARDSWLSSQHVGRQLIVLCHQACGESVRNPVHILGRVLSGMVCEFTLYSSGSCIALTGTPASAHPDGENGKHCHQKCS